MPLADAVIVLTPCTKLDATPTVSTDATIVLLEVHTTDPEMLPVVLSE
jgi:hypothetical protein